MPLLAVLIFGSVATVPTVYGIETQSFNKFCIIQVLLQQYLPFTVLKLQLVLLELVVH